MKNVLFTAALVAAITLGATSCNKDNHITPAAEAQGSHLLKVRIDALQTKMSGAGAESFINNVQIFAFREDGLLETYYNGDDNEGVLRLSTGDKEIRVVVNGPNLGNSITSLSALENTLSMYTENNSNNFVMVGSTDASIPGDTEISLLVHRLMSKVMLKKITTAFTSPVYTNAGFTVDGIYLTNVAQKCKFFAAYTPDSWYSGTLNLMSDKPLSISFSGNESKSQNYMYYVYPNDPSASSTQTRLVIEATLGSFGKQYYPIDLGKLESNKVYTISDVVITRPGTSSPDIPISSDELEYFIGVAEWDSSTPAVTETI